MTDDSIRFSFGTVHESRRQVIYAVRVHDTILDLYEIEEVASRMRDRLTHRGEPSAEIVVVQGETKETLRLFGSPYSTNRVRNAMFNAAIRWTPIDLS